MSETKEPIHVNETEGGEKESVKTEGFQKTISRETSHLSFFLRCTHLYTCSCESAK